MNERKDQPPVPAGAEPQSVADAVGRRLAALERERKRVRPEDWATLFRQIRTLATQLAEHPFLRGDLEAEVRLGRALAAPDLEEFDRRIDHLAAYVEAKLGYLAQLRAAETGGPVEDTPRLAPRVPQAPGLTRLSSASGPSGSDFDLVGNDDKAPGDDGKRPPRRGVLRL